MVAADKGDRMLKDIAGYEGLYAVSDCGKVWSYRLNRWIKDTLLNNGYYKVALFKDGKQTNILIHRIVAKTFIDNPEGKKEVDHIDNDKSNNKLSNLRWTTPSENMHNLKFVKGYFWNEEKQKFASQITANYKHKHIGYYKTEEEARQAYLNAKKIHHPTSQIIK